jgi:hypothetical protein
MLLASESPSSRVPPHVDLLINGARHWQGGGNSGLRSFLRRILSAEWGMQFK